MDVLTVISICSATAGGALMVVLTPVILAKLGFTAAGIAAGSFASKLMSWTAIYYGGGVPAGGIFAFFQSLGAAGLSWLGRGFVCVCVGGFGWILSIIFRE